MPCKSFNWNPALPVVLIVAIQVSTMFAQSAGSIAGRVFDSDNGLPVPNAKVALIHLNDPRFLESDSPDSNELYGPIVKPVDEAGEFFFGPEYVEKVASPEILVVAQAGGYAFAVVVVPKRVGANHLEFGLERPVAVSGKVLTGEGIPIPGAYVGVFYTDPPLLYSGASLPYGGVVTDEEGNFATEVARYAGMVEAYHPDHVPQVLDLRSTDVPTSGLELRLEQGVTVSGRVEQTTGEPVWGVRVRLRSIPSQLAYAKSKSFFRKLSVESTTNERGVFEFKGVLPGEKEITVSDAFGRLATMRVVAGESHLSSVVIELRTR